MRKEMMVAIVGGIIATVVGGLILDRLINAQWQQKAPSLAPPPDKDCSVWDGQKWDRNPFYCEVPAIFATKAEAEQSCGRGNFERFDVSALVDGAPGYRCVRAK